MNACARGFVMFFSLAIPLQSISAQPARFRVAVLYSNARGPDVKCSLESVAETLRKTNPSLELQTFAYNDNLGELVTTAKHIATENYDIVIGPMMSHEALVTAPIFNAKKIPQFLPIASHPELTSKFPNTIRMISNSKHYAKLAVRHALRNKKTKSILIVANESLPYSRTYRNEFAQQLRLQGYKGDVHSYNYLAGQANYGQIAKTVADLKADFIYAPVYGDDLSSLYITLTDAGLKTKVFTHAGLFEAKRTLLANYKDGVEVRFNGLWDQKLRGRNGGVFMKSVANTCNLNTLQPWSMAAWDALDLALTTHERFPALQGEGFIRAVRRMSFVGLLGPWKLDQNNDPIRPLPVFALKRDGIKLDSIIPASATRD